MSQIELSLEQAQVVREATGGSNALDLVPVPGYMLVGPVGLCDAWTDGSNLVFLNQSLERCQEFITYLGATRVTKLEAYFRGVEALAKLFFDKTVETVEYHFEPESKPLYNGYHVTGEVEMICSINKYVVAATEAEAKAKFIKAVQDGVDVKINDGHELDFQEDLDIRVDERHIDVDLVDETRNE